ncbi:MAG: hypothetical protein GY756_25385 [bacterium]|nr:hypothetical protein [bacterium]
MLGIYKLETRRNRFKKNIYIYLFTLGLATVIFALLKHIQYVEFAGSLIMIISALMYSYCITKEKYER